MHLLDRLLQHDAWSTRLLLDRCARLTDAQLDTEFDIGRRSARATLTHIIRNMELWSALMQASMGSATLQSCVPSGPPPQSHVRTPNTSEASEHVRRPDGTPLPCPATETPQTTTVPALTARLTAAAQTLATVAHTVRDTNAWDQTWLDTLDDPPTRKTYGGAIAHVITHSMHHRAQILNILRHLGLEDLPEGDVLTWENAHPPQ